MVPNASAQEVAFGDITCTKEHLPNTNGTVLSLVVQPVPHARAGVFYLSNA